MTCSTMRKLLLLPVALIMFGCADKEIAYHDFMDGALTVYQERHEFSYEESARFLSYMDDAWQKVSCSKCYHVGRHTAQQYR